MSVFELDDSFRALRGASAEMAAELREHALAVDADPYDMKPHLDVAAFRLIREFMIPRRFAGGPPRIGRHEFEPGTCLQGIVWSVELAYGDPGMVLAAPGSSLAGVLVDQLGDAAQQEHFYGALADGATWSFFGMTEPGRGNDAAGLETALRRESPDLYRLTGTKKYIGNGSRGAIGVVFARTGSGPLSIRAAIVEAGAPGFETTPLDMVGLRGACLGEMRMRDVPVPAEMLLGQHLPATRRGLWGAVRVFNTMRAHVAALAVGTGLALVDLVRAERPLVPGADDLAARLEACRQLVYTAAAAVDRDRNAAGPSSVAKAAAAALGHEVSRWAVRSLPPKAIVAHPLLEKWTRDVCSFEFMEGTTDIQRQHIAKAYLKGRRPHSKG